MPSGCVFEANLVVNSLQRQSHVVRLFLCSLTLFSFVIEKDKSLYLLDDPLSAVDQHVASHIHDRCIMGQLADKTRILCTHHTKLVIPYVLILNIVENICCFHN